LGNDDITDTATPTPFSPIKVSKADDAVLGLDNRRVESLSNSFRKLSFSKRVLSFREDIKQFPTVQGKATDSFDVISLH
jgi:hypothetical protein